MKKLFLIFVAVAFLCAATSAWAINVKETTEEFNAGSSTTDHEEVIATVYNYTGAALANGDVLTWDLTSDDGRSVTKVNRLGQKVAGVAKEAIAAGKWGKMVVYGYHSAVKVYCATGYTITAGWPLYAYGDSTTTANSANTYDGYAGQAAANTSVILYPSRPFGQALDAVATATATTVEAFIDCL